jgi:hypothetical protein
MDENELRELTRKTAERLFGPAKKGSSAYALWREFDPEVIFQMGSYGGAPCTVEALRTLKRVLQGRGEWREAPPPAPGTGRKSRKRK